MPAAHAAAAAAHADSPAPPVSLGEMTIEHGAGSQFPVYLHRDESADSPAASPSTANYTSGALRGGGGERGKQEVAGRHTKGRLLVSLSDLWTPEWSPQVVP